MQSSTTRGRPTTPEQTSPLRQPQAGGDSPIGGIREKEILPSLHLVARDGPKDCSRPQATPDLTTPEVSCRMVTGFIEYFREKEGQEFIDSVISAAGLPASDLKTDRWVSRAYVESFVEEAVTLNTLDDVAQLVGVVDAAFRASAGWGDLNL